jgi:hypothetical protein
MSNGRITEYGFEFGAAKVERAWEHKGHVGLTIYTGKQLLNVRITPSGLIRVGEIEPDWHGKQQPPAPPTPAPASPTRNLT